MRRSGISVRNGAFTARKVGEIIIVAGDVEDRRKGRADGTVGDFRRGGKADDRNGAVDVAGRQRREGDHRSVGAALEPGGRIEDAAEVDADNPISNFNISVCRAFYSLNRNAFRLAAVIGNCRVGADGEHDRRSRVGIPSVHGFASVGVDTVAGDIAVVENPSAVVIRPHVGGLDELETVVLAVEFAENVDFVRVVVLLDGELRADLESFDVDGGSIAAKIGGAVEVEVLSFEVGIGKGDGHAAVGAAGFCIAVVDRDADGQTVVAGNEFGVGVDGE